MADELFGGFFEIMSQTNEVKRLFYELATGKHETNPFSMESINEGRRFFFDTLRKHGAVGYITGAPQNQPYLLHALGEALQVL